jgi:hypothetical protein
MSSKPSSITIQFAPRAAAKRGIIDSDDWNDNFNEVSSDFNNFASQWNNRLIPLVDTLPDGTVDTDVDAFGNGLDGRTIYVNYEATTDTSTSKYYNTIKNRPRTISEQFINVYQTIDSNLATVQDGISSSSRTASEVSIIDAGGLFTSTNVEDALQELMTAINSLIS